MVYSTANPDFTQRSNRPMRTLLFTLSLFYLNALSGAVLVPEKRWPNGSTLNVWFIDGAPHWHQLVESTASEWSKYGNLQFRFFTQQPSNSHIRISFEGYDGTQLGRHQSLNSDFPTMRLGSVTKTKLPLEYKKRIILHEFGHALGFEHEFRHPQWPYGDAWPEQQKLDCASRLSAPEDDVLARCEALTQPLDDSLVWAYPFDPDSIMNYPAQAKWLDNRLLDIEPALELSELDKIAMAASYPQHSQSSSLIRLQFINHCPETVHVRLKQRSNESLRRSLALGFLKSSLPVDLGEGEFQFRAISQSGHFSWRSRLINDEYLTYHTQHWASQRIQIPLYCHPSQ